MVLKTLFEYHILILCSSQQARVGLENKLFYSEMCSVALVMSNSANSWTVAHQAPLSMRFSRLEYWSWFGCHSLLQGIFLTRGSNPCLLHCRHVLYPLSHLGSPYSEVEHLIQFRLYICNQYLTQISYANRVNLLFS